MIEIKLPTKKVKSSTNNPKLMLMYSPPKTGKTTLLSKLDNCLIIDDCYCECMNDSDEDGICDENEQQGCIDTDACNYDENIALGGIDDGSCIFPGDECIAEILEGGELIYGTYNEDCICVYNNSSVQGLTRIKTLIKKVDLIGRDMITNGFMIEIYDDGSIEKKIVIE